MELWREPNTLDDRLSAEGQLLGDCEAQIALDLPCSTTSPPAYYHLPIPAVPPAHLQLPTSIRSPPWTPKNLVMPCPSGHHLCIQFHRIPQRRSTATSDILIHHPLKMQTQTCSYDFIYCLYHGEVEESVLYFLTSCEHQATLVNRARGSSPAEINSRKALLNRSWPRRKKGVLKFGNNETRKQIIFYEET